MGWSGDGLEWDHGLVGETRWDGVGVSLEFFVRDDCMSRWR